MAEKMKLSGFLVQLGATICVSYLTSLFAFVLGWHSYTLAIFSSNETVLNAEMSTVEVSLLSSLVNIGAMVMTPFCGYALDTLGRKYAAMVYGLPFVIGWTIISFSRSVPMVMLAVGIAGTGAAGQAVSSILISEVCYDSVRGALTSVGVPLYFVGLLISYALGGQLEYDQVAYVCLALSVLYFVMMAFLKESPVFLILKGKEEEAAKSIAFYRQVDVSSKEVEVEIAKIKMQMDPRFDEMIQAGYDPTTISELLEKPADDSEGEAKPKSAWKTLWKSKSSKRALMVTVTGMVISTFMGSVAVQVYAESMFQEAVPSMNSNECAMYLAVDFVLSSCACTLLLDRLGRKFLMTWTSVASAVFTLMIGTQLIYYWAPHWLTAVLIYGYCFIYNLGAAVVPYVLTAEVFLPEVRGICNSIFMTALWGMNFVTVFIFNPIVESVGLGLVFCGFSVICVVGAVFSHYCIPETKGLSVNEIQLELLGIGRRKEKRERKEAC